MGTKVRELLPPKSLRISISLACQRKCFSWSLVCNLIPRFNCSMTEILDKTCRWTRQSIKKAVHRKGPFNGKMYLYLKPRANGHNVVGYLPTLLDVTCRVRLHTLLNVFACCWKLLHPFAHYYITNATTSAIIGSTCWELLRRLHIAKRLTGFKLCATTCNRGCANGRNM